MPYLQVAEAEVTSLSQQRRIEELEMQLQEAEEIVRDLRTELKGVHDELEKVKNNLVQPLDEQMIKRNAATSPEDTSQEHKLNTSETILLPPDSGWKPLSTCDMKNMPLNQRISDGKCCFVLGNATTQIEPLSDSPMENYYAGNPELASIMIRSKEPELYRNGCTQRIRAFERNLLEGGELPLPGQADDQCLHVKTGSIIREDEKVDETCTVASSKTDNMGIAEISLTRLEEVKQDDSGYDKGQAVKFFRRFSNRRKRSRFRNTKATSHNSLPDQAMKTCELSFLSRSKTYPYPVSNVESSEDPARITEDGAQGCVDDTGSDDRVMKAESVQNVTNKDPALIDESMLTSQESKAAESLGVLNFKMNLDTVDVTPKNSGNKDEKGCETTTAAPTHTVNDKLLKYTFRRKRKKELLSSPNQNEPGEKNPKRKTGDKQNSAPEPQKSSLIMESSRDSRRLVQVARQVGDFSLSLALLSQCVCGTV